MSIVWAGLFTELKQPLSTRFLIDCQRDSEKQAATLHNAPNLDPSALAKVLYEAGQSALLLGQGEVALGWFSQAYQVEPMPMLRVAQSHAFHFNGEYRAMYAALDTLPDLFTDPLLPALVHRLHGLSALDHDLLPAAQLSFRTAEVGLRDRQSAFDHIAVRLDLAETLTRLEALDEAQALLNTLDDEMKRTRHQWFRPRWCVRQAHIYWMRGMHDQAAKLARRGLGEVTDFGSSSTLAELYRLLAVTMDETPAGIEDARDARQRAVEAARTFSSRLDLARSLFTIGLHTKTYTNRATDRARGSGYIYEAEQLYRQMNMPAPVIKGAGIPLL